MNDSKKKTLTFAIMDAPFESARSTTAFRLMDAALRRGHDVRVFAYEGAVALTFDKQAAHPNAVHGRDAAEEDHPLPKDQVRALQALAKDKGCTMEWINCGLCVDERGVGEAIEGTKRGTPGDLWKWAESSDNTLIIPTRG
ncbi:MAG: DsrE family protein [Myxococcales bacterium]|nr:DsrE family protein [Myxococcales bacterium]MDD9971868.1 DsrE family protein [Myxococcales bacterium]